MSKKIVKSEVEWRGILSPLEYHITRERGTERAFTGDYWRCTGETGKYVCRCCGEELFDSRSKYNSGCGWPSFTTPLSTEHVEEKVDLSHGMVRTEVVCSRCDAHLGHVFDDGPDPSGLRYCINSASLRFKPRTDNEAPSET